jgi:hypothetical protein
MFQRYFLIGEKTMRKHRMIPLAFLLVLPLAPVLAQQPGSVQVTGTTVARITRYRVNPGQRGAFDQDVMDHLIPIYEEYKKAGIITDYAINNNVTQANANDWNVAIILTYANFAALDNLGARQNPILLKHYGSQQKQDAAAEHRRQIRSIVQNFLTQAQRYSRR